MRGPPLGGGETDRVKAFPQDNTLRMMTRENRGVE